MAKSSNAKKYLKERCIGYNVAVDWKLGYAPDGVKTILEYFHKKGITTKELLEAKLLRGTIQSPRPFFRNRLMFPLIDENGDVWGFSGRTISNDKIKYINSPFPKAKVVFGLDKACEHIKEDGIAIITEGQFDCIRAHIHGDKRVVASCGTALSNKIIDKLHAMSTGFVALCFDGDEAGEKATKKILTRYPGDLLIMRPPAGKDLDEAILSDNAFFEKVPITPGDNYMIDDFVESKNIRDLCVYLMSRDDSEKQKAIINKLKTTQL